MTMERVDIDAAVLRARRERAKVIREVVASLWPRPSCRHLLPSAMRPASPPKGHAARRILGWSVDGMLVTALLAFALGFWGLVGAGLMSWAG